MLSNKNIIVTGVGKGLGFDLLNKIVSYNGYVYGITKSKEDLTKFKNIKNCKVFLGDVRNTTIFKKVIIQSKKDKRIISGLVNNAGERQRIKFSNINKKKLLHLFEVNFFSIFENMQIYSGYLKSKKIQGSIVNVGSIVGNNGFSELSGYASTKTALIGLTKSFAVEMAKDNIRANLVNPGFIKTSYFEKFKKNKKLYNWTISRIPEKRWGNPNEVSNVICFLLSDLSSYINGTSINVDGGWSGG
jgi:NAD(P)-dependent dehydrogenase (short-subunit alcohol dehydrogenase family)|tara:strand:- start:1781 stop:2515 length:735 start_codon:yes stop_codon:yes gene_type:complete